MNLLNEMNTTGNSVQFVVGYDDLKKVCEDLFNQERIRQEQLKKKENNGMLNNKQAMEMLGVKAETLWRWHKSGYLRHVKVGNRNYFKRCDLERILQNQQENCWRQEKNEKFHPLFLAVGDAQQPFYFFGANLGQMKNP